MIHSWRDIVYRARVYLADDHNEQRGWLKDPSWLALARTEFSQLYRRWVRLGLVKPQPVETSFSNSYSVLLPTPQDFAAQPARLGCLAVIGVAEDMGSYMRILRPMQPSLGSYTNWVASGEMTGKASGWTALGASDSLTIEVSPRDTGSTYHVRWLPLPALPTTLDDQVELPFGCDERLVLGIARRALVKDGSSSQLLERLIVDADAEIQFAAHGRLDSQAPRVRRIKPSFRRQRWPWMSDNNFPSDPNYWLFP